MEDSNWHLAIREESKFCIRQVIDVGVGGKDVCIR